jgi:hypothetical protein
MEAQPLQRHQRRRFPVMLFEVFVLLVAVKRIEEKFTGQRETIKRTSDPG